MSTSDEIFKVFQDEINQKSKQVKDKFGDIVFYDGLEGMSVYNFLDLDEEDRILLARISERDKLEQEADKILNTEEGDP